MPNDSLSFDEEDADDDADNLVRCAECGKQILGSLTRCPHCRVHFQGEAQDFYHESELPSADKPLWVVIVTLILLVMMIGGALWLW